jgi:hypothetical protein
MDISYKDDESDDDTSGYQNLGFNTERGEWFLSVNLIIPAALRPRVYSAASWIEYQKQYEVELRSVRKADNLAAVSRLSRQCGILRNLTTL